MIRSCRSMVDRETTNLEVAGSTPVTIIFSIWNIYRWWWNRDHLSDRSSRDDGVSEYNRIAACCIGGEMHSFNFIVDWVNLPDRVWKEAGGACCVESGVLHDCFSIFEVNVHPLIGGFQEETESNQKFAFGQSDARELLVRPAVEVSLLQLTSVICH